MILQKEFGLRSLEHSPWLCSLHNCQYLIQATLEISGEGMNNLLYIYLNTLKIIFETHIVREGCTNQNPEKAYRTRDPFCCFWMTRNVKRGPEATIWTVDPSGRSTNLLIWMVLTCRSICCFCPF